jgi:hypothetical protein
MALKKTETEMIENALRNSRFWRSGEPFTANDCHVAITSCKSLKHVDRRQVQTVLYALLQNATIEKAGQKTYRVRNSKRALISRPWGPSAQLAGDPKA